MLTTGLGLQVGKELAQFAGGELVAGFFAKGAHQVFLSLFGCPAEALHFHLGLGDCIGQVFGVMIGRGGEAEFS